MGYNYNAYPWGRWIKWGVIGLVIFILLVSTVSSYNGLASADQKVKRDWSQVENVMQSRADKITLLVDVVKGYEKHEEKVFGDIAAARSVLHDNTADIGSKIAADDKMANAYKSLRILVENYPDLKASEQYHSLQIAIEGAENRVTVERMRFIDSVEIYNSKVIRFPGKVTAKVFGFDQKDYFKASPEAQKVPEF